MVKFVQASEDKIVKNINISPDITGPYNKVINWISKDADGYIIVFSNITEENPIKAFMENADKTAKEAKNLAFSNDNMKVFVITHNEYKGMGGRFGTKDSFTVPTMVSIFEYNIVDGDIVIHVGSNEQCSQIIPVVINYAITYKKSFFRGKQKATIKIMGLSCLPGTLFYKIGGINVKYPITEQMMRNTFTIELGKESISIFADGKYSSYYTIKQKRV